MDKFGEIAKFLINTNTVNFIIMVLILGYLVKKMNLGKSFEQGIDSVKALISKSDDAKSTSKKHFDEAQALINGLPKDIKTLENNSAEKIDIFKAKISDNTQKAITNIAANVEKSVSIEEKKISNLLTEQTSKDAILQTKTNLEEMLAKNPELHNKFIENSIKELDKAEL